jgi:hypothetical protein
MMLEMSSLHGFQAGNGKLHVSQGKAINQSAIAAGCGRVASEISSAPANGMLRRGHELAVW